MEYALYVICNANIYIRMTNALYVVKTVTTMMIIMFLKKNTRTKG